MRLIRISIVVFFIIFGGNSINAQCLSFAKLVAKPQLAPFTHDGNYNATLMEEGETAELNKTFFSGQEYRLVLATVDALPKNIRIRLLNQQRKVIYDNADHNYTYVWDFKLETTENLIIHIKIPDEDGDKIRVGCIAIMFGIKMSEKQKKR